MQRKSNSLKKSDTWHILFLAFSSAFSRNPGCKILLIFMSDPFCVSILLLRLVVHYLNTPIEKPTIQLDRVPSHRNVGANLIRRIPLVFCLTSLPSLVPILSSMIWGSRRRSSSLWHVKRWATECTSLVFQHLRIEAAKSDGFGHIVLAPNNRFFLATYLLKSRIPWFYLEILPN